MASNQNALSSTALAGTTSSTREQAQNVLRELVGHPEAEFHDGQFEAIEALVDGGRRALVVQRTGWGKSAVYFVASLLLRRRGAGPTLIVSPLLALMRDQVAAAARAGVRAVAINSANQLDWDTFASSSPPMKWTSCWSRRNDSLTRPSGKTSCPSSSAGPGCW